MSKSLLDRSYLEIFLKMANGDRVVEHFNSEKTALSARNKLVKAFNAITDFWAIESYIKFDSEFEEFWKEPDGYPNRGIMIEKGANINDVDIVKELVQYDQWTKEYGRWIYKAKPRYSHYEFMMEDIDRNANNEYFNIILKEVGLESIVPFASYRFIVKDKDTNKNNFSGWYIAIADKEFKSHKEKTLEEYRKTYSEMHSLYCEKFGTLFTSDLKDRGIRYDKTTNYELKTKIEELKSAIKFLDQVETVPASEKQERFIASLCNKSNIINPEQTNKFNDFLTFVQAKKFNKYQAMEIIGALYDLDMPEEFKLEDIISFYRLKNN